MKTTSKVAVAIKCCLCGRKLTDPTSVNMGVGPVCVKRYMTLDADPDIPLAKRYITMGAKSGAIPTTPTYANCEIETDLSVSGLFSVLSTTVDEAAASEVGHRVLYLLGCMPSRPAVVMLSCVLRALGYKQLSAQVQRVVADVEVQTGDLDIFFRSNDDLKEISDALWATFQIPSKIRKVAMFGSKWVLVCPLSARKPLWCYLRVAYSGKWMYSSKGLVKIP